MSVSGVAFAVLLVLIVLSLYRGWSGVGKLITKLPGDVWDHADRHDRPLPLDVDPAGGKPRRPDGAARRAAGAPVYARTMGFEQGGVELSVYFMALDAPGGRAAAGRDARALLPAARARQHRQRVLAEDGPAPRRHDSRGRPRPDRGRHQQRRQRGDHAVRLSERRGRAGDLRRRGRRQLLSSHDGAGIRPAVDRRCRGGDGPRCGVPHERGVRHRHLERGGRGLLARRERPCRHRHDCWRGR